MQFNEVIGREKTKSHLRDLVEQNRLSHALLFLGREGSGALPMAIAFAQYVLCERGKSEQAAPSLFGDAEPSVQNIIRNDSCGVCPSCTKVKNLVHPDLHFSYPVVKRDSKHDRALSTDYIGEWRAFVKEFPYGNVNDWIDFLKNSPTAKIESSANKQGNITVHECDDILHKLSLRPYEGDYKILILWMPEYLGKEGNRLLKLIEEPPAGTLFIFVAEDENEILSTILSRTQLVKIPLPENEEVEKYLAGKSGDAEKASTVAGIANGNLREALRIFQNGEENWERMVRDWLNLALKNKVDLQSKWIDEVNLLGREKQKQLLQYFIHLIEISIKLKFLHPDDVKVLVDSEKEFAGTLEKMCEVEVLEEMVNEINKAIYHIERNANSKLLFHALTIRLYHLIREKYLILVQ